MSKTNILEQNEGFNVSNKYVPIETGKLVETFIDAGYTIRDIKSARTLNPDKEGYQRHQVRMYHPDTDFKIDGLRPEVILRNSYDGSSAFRISLGVFRLICTNGLEVGNTYESYRLVHMGSDVLNQVLAACTNVQAFIPKVKDDIMLMQDTILDYDKAFKLVQSLNPVLDKDILPETALRTRRLADKELDAFTVFNVIQENILHGHYQYTKEVPVLKGIVNGQTDYKTVKGRAIKSIETTALVNKALWDATLKLCA